MEGDVGDIIRARAGAYDAILLDVDNGPDGLTSSANDRLYDGPGLAAARAALKPGGVAGDLVFRTGRKLHEATCARRVSRSRNARCAPDARAARGT